MAFDIQYAESDDCIKVHFTEEITMPVVREYIKALLPILEKTKCRRLLSDCRTAEIQLSSLDIIKFPKMAAISPLTAQLRRAVLATPGTSGYELYETLSELQGQQVHVFSDEAEAMAWLMEEPQA